MSEAQPEAGRWQGGAHYLPVRVYYEDTDFTGIVYYANYLKFFERGRTDALRTAGLSHAELLKSDPPLGFAVRKVTVEYHAAARIDDALLVETCFASLSGVRMQIKQAITRDGALLASAEVEAVCIDMDGRPKRLPSGLKEALGRMAGPF
jgi:acyl-CoA thioester hydrolase